MCGLLLGGNYFRWRSCHRCLMLSDWVLLNYSNKLFRGLTRSPVSFIKSEGRMICKWGSFPGTMGGKNMWQGASIWIQITTQGLITWLTGGAGVWGYCTFLGLFVCSSSILISWNPPLSQWLGFISAFTRNSESAKIPVEILMHDAQLGGSPNNSAVGQNLLGTKYVDSEHLVYSFPAVYIYQYLRT